MNQSVYEIIRYWQTESEAEAYPDNLLVTLLFDTYLSVKRDIPTKKAQVYFEAVTKNVESTFPKLTAKERDVITLIFKQNNTIYDVVNSLKMPESTINDYLSGALKKLRKSARQVEVPENCYQQQIFIDVEGKDEWRKRKDDESIIPEIDEAIAKLTQKEKEVILLFYSEGKSMSEISKIYLVSPERIRQILAKARRIIKARNRVHVELDERYKVLSERACNCIMRAGITFDTLMSMTEDEVRRIRNLGPMCSEEVIRFINDNK